MADHVRDDDPEYDTRSEASSSSGGSDSDSSSSSSDEETEEKENGTQNEEGQLSDDEPGVPGLDESGTSENTAQDSNAETDPPKSEENPENPPQPIKKERSPIRYDLKDDEEEKPPSVPKRLKKPKSYDYVTKLNYLFRDARFFLMKSGNVENVNIAKGRGVWATLAQNEARLNLAYEECRNVLVIFSVKESGKFAGFGRLASASRYDLPPVNWLLPPGISPRALGGTFQIDWISRKELPFIKTTHLFNAWNEGKPVKIGRDGQEIEPKTAEELCRLFPEDEAIELTPILYKSKRAARRMKLREEASEAAAPPAAVPSSSSTSTSVSTRGRPSNPRDMDVREGGGFGGGSYISRDLSTRRKRRYDDYGTVGGNFRDPKRGREEYMDGRNDRSPLPMDRYPPPRGLNGWNAFDPLPPPRYYEAHPSHPLPGVSSRHRDKREYDDRYDRSVDDFIRQNVNRDSGYRDKSRDRSPRRYRDRR